MLRIIKERLRQKKRTIKFPADKVQLPDRLRGLPRFDNALCPANCLTCIQACPTQAMVRQNGALAIDLGKCLFCTDCMAACPHGAISFTTEYRLATASRENLVYAGKEYALAAQLDKKIKRLFGRSLKLRQVSAGGCNACEADINVLNTPGFDLGRFGIQVVASPRHADGMLITGPVSNNMRLGLEKTWAAIPAPKLVIVVGACAISGGPFIDHQEVMNGAQSVVPVDLFIPGCPPHPLTILDGLLRLIGRLERS
jgi:Ni,Fe-hydrogenase III small subunit/Pyruvate/2-oxoacid:ferredoxin oxidoreductase delta subunit